VWDLSQSMINRHLTYLIFLRALCVFVVFLPL
jgi:hypothetical protein